MSTFLVLLQSRKFYIGMLTIVAVAAATFLRAKGWIPPDALLPTIAGICVTGCTTIGSIAWEDSATKKGRATAHHSSEPGSLEAKVDAKVIVENDTGG